VALFSAGFKKYEQIAVFSVGVDTISRGTGNRDPRIGNPGSNWAYFTYAFPGGLPVVGR